MAGTLTEEAMRSYEAAGAIVKAVKRDVAALARPGARHVDLAVHVEEEIRRLGGRPAFPCNIAVNDVASHCTPRANDTRELRPGDLVKIDLGAMVDGYLADSAVTVAVDTDAHSGLIEAAERALADAIRAIWPGAYACEVGGAVEASARARGYNVLKGLYGHSLERDCLHGGLTIPNYDDGMRKKIQEGDVLAIEPFLTSGNGEVAGAGGSGIFQAIRRGPYYAADERGRKLLMHIDRYYNGFPFARRWLPDPGALDDLIRSGAVKEYPVLVERDGQPVAQAEHTVIVSHDGCRIIT